MTDTKEIKTIIEQYGTVRNLDLEIWKASKKHFPMEWRAMTFMHFAPRKDTIETYTFFEVNGEELRFDFEVSGDTFRELGDWDGVFKAMKFMMSEDVAFRESNG